VSISLYGARRTKRLGIQTPLLVPSFSSRGFPAVREFIEALRKDISDLCLISAFDVARGHVPEDFETFSDVLVLDSGLYESRSAPVTADTQLPSAATDGWTRADYRRFLGAVAPKLPLANTIVVSYDDYGPLPTQLEAAREDFEHVPGVARDILLKPAREGMSLELDLHDLSLDDFDIVGVTERELGRSAFDRCCALIRLRRALDAAGNAAAIHVFGSITPAAVTAYFLCGADVFDGLNWLRVGLSDMWAAAPSEFSVAHGLGHLDDREVDVRLWQRNLRFLRHTQTALRTFSSERDEESLCTRLPFARAPLDLAGSAYASLGERS
jgi:hypothetical protein